MDLRGLDSLLECEWRKDASESFSEHRFSRARRSDHQDIVPARGGHFEGALRSCLTANFAKVGKGGFARRCGAGRADGRLKLIGLSQIFDDLCQVAHSEDSHTFGDGSGICSEKGQTGAVNSRPFSHHSKYFWE